MILAQAGCESGPGLGLLSPQLGVDCSPSGFRYRRSPASQQAWLIKSHPMNIEKHRPLPSWILISPKRKISGFAPFFLVLTNDLNMRNSG